MIARFTKERADVSTLMSTTNSEAPIHYIERVRMRTVYPQARGFINVIFWLSIIAISLVSVTATLASFAAAFQSESLLALFPAVGLLIGMVIYVFVLIFLKSVAVAYFDAVDVLIESSRKKKEEVAS
jgi:hypothetical protein